MSDIAARGNDIEISESIRNYDRCFDSTWRFDSVRWQMIRLNKTGVLLFFHKIIDGIEFKRWYAFGKDDLYISGASETRSYANGTKSFGSINVDQTGIFLIEQIIEMPDTLKSGSKLWEVTYEEYYGCQLLCTSVFQGEYHIFRKFRSKEEFMKWKSSLHSGAKPIKSTCR